MKSIRIGALVVLAVAAAIAAQASEISHYSPSMPSIRDFVVPDPGFVGIIYSYAYMSDQLNDRNGDEISQVTIGAPPATATLDVDVDLDVFVVVPGVMWASNWKILGATYGAYAMIPFSNTSIGASLTTATGTGRSVEESQFAMADPFVMPLWLSWISAHWGITAGYGFAPPLGKYDTESVVIPHVGELTAESPENIGLGFWTHELQGAATWYPWADKRMAVLGALTWEINGQKKDFDLTPGQNLALNWGAGEYLPLKKDQSLLLEVGPTGYNSWQITDDSGDDVQGTPVRDEVHGVGLQVGATYVPWKALLNFRYLYEYGATDRFQGQSFGLNFAIHF